MLSGRRNPAGAAGFTLIEVIVGMVLTGILLVLVTTFLIGGLSGSQKSSNERKALEAVNGLVAQFSSDVEKVKSPHRAETIVTDPGELQEGLLSGRALQGTVDGSTITLDVRDIVEATATSLTVRSDVHPNAGTECVRYWVQGGTNALMRTVRTYNQTTRSCTGATLQSGPMLERVR